MVCAAATCAGSSLHAASHCDGAGACAGGAASSCDPYACNPATFKCRTTCDDDTQCVAGLRCIAGACKEGAHCTGDLASSVGKDGASSACAPFLCDPIAGTCRTACESSAECAIGSACDAATKTCNPIAASGGGDGGGGGCALTPSGTSGGLLAGFGLLLIVGLARRGGRSKGDGR